MASDVRFRHWVRQGDWQWYAYDGELSVVDGVLTVPAENEHWMRRAWVTGFRKHPDTGELIEDFEAHIRAELSRDEQSAESAEDSTDEGADNRGQSTRSNRVRKGQPAGS